MGQDQGLVHWQEGGSAQLLAHVSMDLQSKGRDLNPATCPIKTEIVCEEKGGCECQLKRKKNNLKE